MSKIDKKHSYLTKVTLDSDGSNPVMEYVWLLSLGAPPDTINGMWKYLLEQGGYSGDLPDMIYEWLLDNGFIGPEDTINGGMDDLWEYLDENFGGVPPGQTNKYVSIRNPIIVEIVE